MSLSEQLQRLTISQDSIVQTSQIFQQQYKKNKQNFQFLINEWFDFYLQQTENQGRLKMLYLANDILQRLVSQKDNNFANAIKDKLDYAFKDCFNQQSEKFKEQVNKILIIWQQRNIFPKQVIREFKGEQNPQKHQKDDSHIQAIEDLIPIPQELIQFAQANKDLKKWSEKEKDTYNKIQNSKNQQDKEVLLKDYKKSLEFQQKYRHNCLIHEANITMSIDKEHLKMVLELKKIQNKIDELDQLE